RPKSPPTKEKSKMVQTSPPRSGCALALGVLLVGAGGLLLASNVFGLSLEWLWTHGVVWFGTYWPVLLIVWGGYKIYQRLFRPDVSRVGAGEILLLIFIVCVGLTVGIARRATNWLAADLSIDEVMELFGPEISFGPAHRFTEEHRFEIPKDRGLLIENDRGSVTVRGWDESDLKVVEVKRIRHHSEERAAQMVKELPLSFEVDAEGPSRLETTGPYSPRSRVETDLDIWVPRTVPLTLSNRRGPVRISEMRAAVGLATSYDPIEVRDIEGNVRVEGRHGPLRIQRIRGDVEARNRYGTLTVKDVQGELIGETANGSLVVDQITGTARLTNQHSRIRATRIGGDLTIEATQAEVSVEEAGATVSIETSYRPVFVKGARGRVVIETRNSDIEVRDAAGDLEVSNLYRSVTAVGIGGGVVIDSRHSAVRVEDVNGPIQVKSSHHRAEIRTFRSSLVVEATHAPLKILADALGGDLRLATTYGDIELVLPPESSFRLEAKSREGQVFCDFETPEWARSRNDDTVELAGTTRDGANQITLATSYADIRIRKVESR
ncbi:MAG: DUF4097 family beta strand repeat-containing protein, partial [Acidobacteriota bacterium]